MISNNRVKTWGRLAIVAALLLLLGIVGTMDYQDEIAEANAYCQNVAEGVWPDYNGTYDKWCEDRQPAARLAAPNLEEPK